MTGAGSPPAPGQPAGTGTAEVRPANAETIAEAAWRLRAGELVAFPTETVYGLGADAGNDAAVAAVFAAKDRPRFNPLIVHLADQAAAEALAVFDDRARAVAWKFWPGPLTLVLPRRPGCPLSLLVSAGLETVALRVPNHPTALALLAVARRPIAAPSANRSGAVSPTTAAHVAADLGERAGLILDGGPCRIGVESTVVDLTGEQPALLRPGGLAVETLERFVGPLARATDTTGRPRSPGLLARHYAPGRGLRCYAHRPEAGEAFLGFGPDTPGADLNLSPDGDLTEAAGNLFAMLRRLDAPPFTGIAVAPVPEAGLGRAINDRLRRAAAASREPDDFDRGPSAPCVLPDDDDIG